MPWNNERDRNKVAAILRPILLGHGETDNVQYRIFYKNMLKNGCRQLERFMTPVVSTEAQRKAHEMGVGELSLYNWNHQRKEMKDDKRSIFHWEHVYPVSSIANALLGLTNVQIEEITKILSIADIAWILKSEDRMLNKKGYKSKRPENPWDAYTDCGIGIERVI